MFCFKMDFYYRNRKSIVNTMLTIYSYNFYLIFRKISMSHPLRYTPHLTLSSDASHTYWYL